MQSTARTTGRLRGSVVGIGVDPCIEVKEEGVHVPLGHFNLMRGCVG